MAWVEAVMLLAVAQYLAFGMLVGRARGKYGVQAPATSGDEMFERFYRVQMNTLELLPVLLPSLWLAAKYWTPEWVAGAGLVYLLGRLLYLKAYITNPPSRGLGFMLSYVPIMALLIAALVGAVRATQQA